MHCLKSTSVVTAAAFLLCGLAHAQRGTESYPTKPVRVVASTGVGGAADVNARLFSAKLGEALGNQFIVDNRPGITLAMPIVARAAADGYTLLAVVPEFTSAPALYKDLSSDPVKDFAPIAIVTRAPYILSVNPSVNARSIAELIALAKAQPGKLNFGGSLPGAGTHLIAMWLFSLTGIQATYVPYKGGVSQATVDLMSGRIQAGFSTGSAIAHIKAGRLRALGVSTAQRATFLPDIPTIAEQGVPGFDASTYHGFAAPARTPPAIISKLNAELVQIAKMPEIVDKLRADNSEPVGSTPEEFRQKIAAEVPRWRKLVQDTGATAH